MHKKTDAKMAELVKRLRFLSPSCGLEEGKKGCGVNKISLEHVDKCYDRGVQVIEDLNLDIREGSFTILLGPSGCGKSTTLRMIAGLEEASGGTLSINGEDMKDVPPGERDIAMVFQNYAIYPTMTVRGNIEFGLKNAGVPKAERNRRIQEIGEITGLNGYMKRKPNALSGGQRQRVALARALVKNPQVFLMDEPLSNLDARLRAQLRTELIELHQKLGTTFVYVTHDQAEAMSMGSHIVLMHEGKIMQQGSPEEIYRDPENVFTAKFIGTPPMNVLETGCCPASWKFPEQAVWAGFRPEHVEFGETPDSIMLEGNVLTREMLGAEILYKLDTPQGCIQARDYHTDAHHQGHIRVWVPRNSICFFDKKEERLRA